MQHTAPKAQITPPVKRFGLRFSLRTLLVVMAFVGVLLAAVFTPILHELRLATETTRYLIELKDDKQLSYEAQRRAPSYSLWLTEKVWPWQVVNLRQEITTLRVNPGPERDLAKLPPIPSVREWRFAYGTAVCSDPNFRQPYIRSISYVQAKPLDPPPDPDDHLLTHVPNVEEVGIWGVPADTNVLNDLSKCAKLRRLELYLDARWVDEELKRHVLPFNDAPLRGLRQLEELWIRRLPPQVDWSFLAEMSSLREAMINPLGSDTPGGIYSASERRPATPREETPLYHLAGLKNLRRVELQSTAAYAEDLKRLAQNSPLERLELEHVPEGAKALAGLQSAKSLGSLHLKVSQFRDLPALENELRQLPQLRELSCEFQELTLAHAELLASLKQVESLRITFVDAYSAGPAGSILLASLPLHEFHASYEWLPEGDPPSEMQKLTTLAAQKQRARELASEQP